MVRPGRPTAVLVLSDDERQTLEEMKRLKQLEHENRRLKKLVAEQALDIDTLKLRTLL